MTGLSTFDKIDNYLNDKKSNELSAIFLLLFALIGFVAYSSIYPITEKMLKQSIKTDRNIEGKLRQEVSYLNSVSRNGDEKFYINKILSELKRQKGALEDSVFANSYVDNKLKNLSYLLYNDENWAKFLDSITFIAKEHNVNIKSIKNQFNEPNFQKIEQVLNINVDFSGDFNDVMKFINILEESELVVDIHKIKLESSSSINGTFEILVWGMKY
jgi:hypothetical protein